MPVRARAGRPLPGPAARPGSPAPAAFAFSRLREAGRTGRVGAMKAISYSRYGGPEVLELGEVRDPKVGPDSVLVKVRAAAVNPVDWKCREGYLDGILDAVFPVI